MTKIGALLRPHRVSGPRDKGLELFDVFSVQLSREVRHAQFDQLAGQDGLIELSDRLGVDVAQIGMLPPLSTPARRGRTRSC